MVEKLRVLFLCTGNACRSPMAEALFRQLAGGRYESLSAGPYPARSVHPLAVRAMAEQGIDLSGHRPRNVNRFLPPGGSPPHVVVVLCDHALGSCQPFPQGVGKIEWFLDDPILSAGGEASQLAAFRAIRDRLRGLIENALKEGLLDRPPEVFAPQIEGLPHPPPHRPGSLRLPHPKR